jgi:hypothetical protein
MKKSLTAFKILLIILLKSMARKIFHGIFTLLQQLLKFIQYSYYWVRRDTMQIYFKHQKKKKQKKNLIK